jgi:hypothetical protein
MGSSSLLTFDLLLKRFNMNISALNGQNKSIITIKANVINITVIIMIIIKLVVAYIFNFVNM